jgi:acylglycerol lipase
LPPSKTQKPKGILIIVHGGGWHSGYFDALATKLAEEQSIFVASYDQPGCGYSDPEPRAPKGYTHIRSMDDCVDDLFEAVFWARQQASASSLPLFFLGESYGGVQVLAAALEAKNYGMLSQLKGVVILGGLIKTAPSLLPPAPVISILKFLARYYPSTPAPAVDTSKTFDEAFGNKEWATIARSDPKVSLSFKPTLGAAAAILSAGDDVLERAGEFPVPLLAIHGERDCRTQWEAVQEFVDKAGPNAKIILLDTDGHQLLQDKPPVTDTVMNTVSSWLKDRIASA